MSDIDHISQQVEADRARLARSLDALTDTVNPQSLAQDVSSAATDIGGEIAQKAWNTLRENPAGGLLVAIGVGLLASGVQQRPAPERAPPRAATEPTTAMTGFDNRVAAADAAMRAEMTGEIERPPKAFRMKAALETGLDKLPPKARQRVVQARQAAISAQESIEKQTRRAARKTKGFAYEQPLVASALALGFGVLAATLLPGTRREDALMGKRRDALMADARNALEEELLKAKHQAQNKLAAKTNQSVHQLRA
jgi:ElaB/YqjD/DUF883 family membrane-anchored ribosome-binding protein